MEKQLASYDPSSGEKLGEVPVTSTQQISEIVAQGHAAAKSWKRLGAAQRVKLLEKPMPSLNLS